jgi:nicotinate-nucleotide pyrophosphorylase (carboxylating)
MQLDKERTIRIIKAALAEDIGRSDITTSSLIDKNIITGGVIVAREECVICGVEIADWVISQVDATVHFKGACKDGDAIAKAQEVALIEGHAASILRAERTMLNFLSFLSGIATATRRFVDKAKPYGVRIMDTRKTLPLLRYLEKYAVAAGGGYNHRMGLYDQVLIKENHIAVRKKLKAACGIKESVELARRSSRRGTVIEVEVTDIEGFNAAIAAKPNIIMLDNMRVADVKACVEIRRLAKNKPLLEVSGGITLENVEEYAKARVDMISVGSLTSSIRAMDISLDIA